MYFNELMGFLFAFLRRMLRRNNTASASKGAVLASMLGQTAAHALLHVRFVTRTRA